MPDEPKDFLQGLAEEPIPFLLGLATEPIPPEIGRAERDPPWPDETDVSLDSIENYDTLVDQFPGGPWGLTGLMTVEFADGGECYGPISPGIIFLFPGIYIDDPERYWPEPSIKCEQYPPLHTGMGLGPLHEQMCELLQLPPTTFVGFGVVPPLSPTSFGPNSGICNTYWFGSRTLPPAWVDLVYDALAWAFRSKARHPPPTPET